MHAGRSPVTTYCLTPDAPTLDRAALRLRWLHEHFGGGPPCDATDTFVRQYIRAYILTVIRNILFPKKSGTDVSFFVVPPFEILRSLLCRGAVLVKCVCIMSYAMLHNQQVTTLQTPLSSYRLEERNISHYCFVVIYIMVI